jgi:hypothetical protein
MDFRTGCQRDAWCDDVMGGLRTVLLREHQVAGARSPVVAREINGVYLQRPNLTEPDWGWVWLAVADGRVLRRLVRLMSRRFLLGEFMVSEVFGRQRVVGQRCGEELSVEFWVTSRLERDR